MKMQKGFGIVETLLILVIVGLLGGTGWYVWNAHNKTADTFNNADSANSSAASYSKKQSSTMNKQTEADPSANWKVATSKQDFFSVKIPDGWKITNYGGSDWMRGSGIDYQRGTSAIIEETATPYAGDSPSKFDIIVLKDSQFGTPQGTATNFSIDLLSGKKYSYTFDKDTDRGIGQRDKGDKIYEYRFSVGSGKSLDITYNVFSGDTDQISLVEQVIKTIKLL